MGSKPGVRAPRVAVWLLSRLVPETHREGVVGDVVERHAELVRARGRLRARLWVWGEVVRARPLAMRRAAGAGSAGPGDTEARRSAMATRWLDAGGRDVRQAVRALWRAPGFALAAVVTLGLGTGAATAVFSLVWAVVLSPLPYTEPERLVMLWETDREQNLTHDRVSPVNFMDYRSLDRVFEDAAAWWIPELNLADEAGDPIRVNAVEASENLFDVLGVQPVVGRGFPRDSTLHGPDLEAVISHRLWRTRFGSDASVLGRAVQLNGFAYTLVGVLPPGFHYPGDTDVWQRLRWDLTQHDRAAHFMESVARLRPGVTVEAANRELASLTTRIAADFPRTSRNLGAYATPLGTELAGVFQPALLALLGASGLLLLIACINVANLMLARSTVRTTEVAVRAALGASRGRIAGLLLTESLMLSVAGTVIGVITAVVGVRAFLAWTPVDIPRADAVSVNLMVLGFAAGTSLITTLAFGLAPALMLSRTRLQHVLREGGKSSAGVRRGRSRNVLVAAEVALAVVLLAGAGLLIRSVAALLRIETGVDATRVVTADVSLPDVEYSDWPDVERLYTSLLESIRLQPGVTAAGASNFLPLEAGWRVPYLPEGAAPPARGEAPMAQWHTVDEGWFDAVGAEIVRGRALEARDDATRPGVVVINETLARRAWPDQDPIGRRLVLNGRNIGPLGARLTADPLHEVVGVVRDVQNTDLGDATEAAVYFSQRQFPFRRMHILLRGPANTASLMGVAAAELKRLDPTVPMANVQPLERVMASPADPQRLVLLILFVFASLALTLAAVGIYGTLSYTVSQRRREIGIRMALGARPGEVVGMILGQGLLLGAVGGVIGVTAAAFGGRALSALLFHVSPADPMTLLGVLAIALGVTALACVVPGQRAAGTQPMSTLRNE